MDCKEVEKIILKFINRECTPKEEAALLEHIKECPECKEELTIQLLLQEGLTRLEAGESFDLNVELEKRLNEDNSKKKRRKFFTQEQTVIIIDIIGGAIVVAVIIGLLGWSIF